MTHRASHLQLYTDERNELLSLFELWRESMVARNLAPKTLKNYTLEVGQFLRFLETQGITTPDALQPLHIRRWLVHRRMQGVSPRQLRNDFQSPATFWAWLQREGLVAHNPFATVEKPKAPVKVKPVLTPDEMQALLRACEGTHWLRLRDRALILLLLDTGLRIHEAHALTVADAKQERLFIRGKGGKQRLVFLSPEVRIALHKYLKSCPFPVQEDSPLWWGRYGALTLNGLLEVIQKVGNRAGLRKHLGAHAFRRTFATWSLRSGIDLEHLRQLMGHSDYSVLRHYLALVETDLKEAHRQHSPLQHLRQRK